jgi:hypothetical protein
MAGLPPALFSKEDAEKAIATYLAREMQRPVVSLIRDHPANLVIFGEVHSADAFKAYYLGELVRVVRQRRPAITHFHASERWANAPPTRKIISDLLHAQPTQFMNLLFQIPQALDLVPFAPLLAQAVNFPDRRFGMVPIDMSNVRDEDPRHKALFDSFVNSATLCPDVPFNSITNSASRGHMLLGARHGARTSVTGKGDTTTCALLIGAGWNVHAVRLTMAPDAEQLESLKVVLRRGTADHTPIDVLAILQSTAGGRPFYVDISKSDSPFSEVRDGDPGAADIAFNRLFDAILHISDQTLPFPTQ